MLRIQKTIYSTNTLDTLATSYREGSPVGVDVTVLGRTISNAITRIRDTVSSLELLTQDARTIRGEKTHMSGKYAKKGEYLRLQDMNAQTDEVRGKHFASMGEIYKTLNDYTDRLGASVELLVDYIACSLRGNGSDALSRVIQFYPEAEYNKETGKIEFRVGDGEYKPLTSFAELQQVREYIGNNPLAQSLLEVKLAATALKATIDENTVLNITRIRQYP